MKITRFALPLLLSAGVGCVGYSLGTIRENAIDRLLTNGTLPLEYYASAQSFSEVENTRSVLEALATRYVEHARVLICQEQSRRIAHLGRAESNQERPRLAAIRLLEEGIVEFEGTDHVMRLIPTLLYALKWEGRHDRWLEVYLNAVYHYPTHEVVATMADEAVFIGQAAGRQQDVANALDHLSRVPLDLQPASRPVLVHAGVGSRPADTCPDHVL